MTTDITVLRGIQLLNQLLALKSQLDGVPRASIGVFGPKPSDDKLAQDVQDVALLLFTAQQAIPLMVRLAAAGRHLHDQKLIEVDYSDSFAEKALSYFLAQAPVN